MKVSNWRRRAAAALVACGMISPAAARAASLDTNLVVNGDFESVDFTFTGDYGAPRILNWTVAGGAYGFAYSHDGTSGIPDYADGADPPGAGHWYFTPNNNPGSDTGDWRNPDEVYQDITLNTGATGTQIASGEAAVRLSAWMSSYLNDGDYGVVQVDFKNGGGTTIGTALIQDSDPGPDNVWNLNQGAAVIPVGTTSMRVSIYGISSDPARGGDGYMDNVDVQVTNAANEFLYLEVNTNTGQMAIKNSTGQAANVDYYEIKSASGALSKTGWNSFQDQNRTGFPSGNGSGNGWEEAGGASANVLSESYLTGNSVVANGANLGLGAGFTTSGAHDLAFSYSLVPAPNLSADFNSDGAVDGKDFLIWQRGAGGAGTKATGDATGDGQVNAADLAAWRTDYGAGPSGPGVLTTGFVRYVTTGPVAAVPEPGAIVLAGLGVALVVVRRRK